MHRQNPLRVQSAVRGLRILLFNVKMSSSIDGRALGIIYNDVVKFSLLFARNKKEKTVSSWAIRRTSLLFRTPSNKRGKCRFPKTHRIITTRPRSFQTSLMTEITSAETDIQLIKSPLSVFLVARFLKKRDSFGKVFVFVGNATSAPGPASLDAGERTHPTGK